VDGKTGQRGSGRKGPIIVTDEHFTTAHLRKAGKLPSALRCSICHDNITDFSKNHLAFGLCPAGDCTAVYHMTCLAKDFLSSPSTAGTDIIPRGGECKSCHTYILWGDLVRGCYRRQKGGAVPDSEPESERDSDGRELSGSQTDNEESDRDMAKAPAASPAKRGRGRPRKSLESPSQAPVASPKRGRLRKDVEPSSPAPITITKKRGRPKKQIEDVHIEVNVAGPSKPIKKVKTPAKRPKGKASMRQDHPSDEGEFFDLNVISSDDQYDGAPIAPMYDKAKLNGRVKGKAKAAPPLPATNVAAGPTMLTYNPGEVDFFDMDDSSVEFPDRFVRSLDAPILPAEEVEALSDALSTMSIVSPRRSEDEEQPRAGPAGACRKEIIVLSD